MLVLTRNNLTDSTDDRQLPPPPPGGDSEGLTSHSTAVNAYAIAFAGAVDWSGLGDAETRTPVVNLSQYAIWFYRQRVQANLPLLLKLIV